MTNLSRAASTWVHTKKAEPGSKVVAALESAVAKVPGFPGAGLFLRSGRVDS